MQVWEELGKWGSGREARKIKAIVTHQSMNTYVHQVDRLAQTGCSRGQAHLAPEKDLEGEIHRQPVELLPWWARARHLVVGLGLLVVRGASNQ